jgi:hypothetical protein
MGNYGLMVTMPGANATTETDPAYQYMSSRFFLFKQQTTGAMTVTTTATGATDATFSSSTSHTLGYSACVMGYWSTDQVTWRPMGARDTGTFGVSTQISADSSNVYAYVTTRNTGALTVYIRWTLYIDETNI